ncbi:MAG: XRE family transcriptional regulator [Bacteroidetes bacterium]|nr:MAG: XRE family transcriptional regulator [Bacteroidota bacterium]
MKLNEKLGEKIRCIREIQGLTQQNMADALGITNTAYAKKERGETNIKPERLQEIAKVLGVKVETIEQFDKTVVLNIDYYQQTHEAHKPAMSKEEREAYLLTIDTLTKDNAYYKDLVTTFKDLITTQQEQIRHLLAKK